MNPNCPEVNQLAIYKRGRGFELYSGLPWTNPASGQGGTQRSNCSAKLKEVAVDSVTQVQLVSLCSWKMDWL